MASKLTQIPFHTFKQTTNLNSSSSFIQYPNHTHRVLPKWTLSSPKPPTTKEEAILQAKASLSSTLEKPLNNPKLPGKIKKLKQPRFRVEIPVIDDSASSLAQLALEIFGKMPIRKKGPQIKIVILWSNSILVQAAERAFDSQSADILVENIDLSSGNVLSNPDVVVFMALEASQLENMKTVVDKLNPRPVVMFNPKWGPEEEADFGELSGFVSSFDVVYSFMGLEVRGILSKRKGVVFKCVKDGIVSSEKWSILVEEESGELRVVSSFRVRPSIEQVENVLYNLMAVNSPVTKSAKFLKDLVSNVTGKKK